MAADDTPINYMPVIALGVIGAAGALLYYGKKWVEKLVQKTADRAADRAVDRAIAKVPPHAVANTLKEIQKVLAPAASGNKPLSTDALNQAISQGVALAHDILPKART